MLSFCMSSTWGAVKSSQSIRGAVRTAIRILEMAGVPEAKASAEHLATAAFPSVKRRGAALHAVEKPLPSEIDKYISLCRQREEARVPIQYLVGDWDFHNITLLVRPPVLIPRPETEELVEHLLSDVRLDDARVLDIGCGSGAIVLAALAARGGWSGVGVDVSTQAVQLSEDNAARLGLEQRCGIVHGKIGDLIGEGKFDALVSNPPYIPDADMTQVDSQVRDHEDFAALCGGADGLDVVREIIKVAPRVGKPGASVWLEVDTSHPDLIERMEFEGIEFVRKLRDTYGRPRFCQLRVLGGR